MIIREALIEELKGAGNTLLSMAEDMQTEEYLKSVFLFVGSAIERIVDEVEHGQPEQKEKHSNQI